MDFITAIKKLLYDFLIFLSALSGFLTHRTKIHGARFARLDELAGLIAAAFDNEASLILGVTRLKHVLRVKPTKKQRELGNLLIEAPTRRGKGLLATAQLLTWKHSVAVNDIKGDLFAQTAGYRRTLGACYRS